MRQDVERDLGAIVVPRWGRVAQVDGPVPWTVLTEEGIELDVVQRYLREFVARGGSPLSTRSYAFDLLWWWRWLKSTGVEWNRATSTDVKDYVLWLKSTTKWRRHARTRSATTAGTVNPLTRKQYLDDRYRARTIRHSNAVLRDFYAYWIDVGEGPLLNPVRIDHRSSGRPYAGHNPLQPFGAEGRLAYNPRLPKQQPRALSDERRVELFSALRSNRDRALLSLTISSAARAAEVPGLHAADVDWGERLIRVHRKGSGTPQWLPASPDAFVWLRLYLADLATPLKPQDPLWWTLRRRDHGTGLARQPVDYEALRAVFRRLNQSLGTNWSTHDLRHTAALRMSRDETLTMRDVQTILGHAHLSTTADTYMVEDQQHVIRRVAKFLSQREEADGQPPPVAAGYDSAALSILFGKEK
jgi:site-specific recombinase XerD